MRLGEESLTPTSLVIYPNPLITSSTISFSLLGNSYISMKLLDLAGRKMKTLLEENLEAGDHIVQLNRDQLTAGIYFLKVKMNDESSVLKIIIQ